MGASTIPQRELRNNIGDVLRRVEAGAELTITVRGRAVARLAPLRQPLERREDLDRESLRAILAQTPVDDAFASDLAAIREREEPVDAAWDRS